LECRLTPSATVQFSVGSETVNQTAGTFSIPVTLTGAVTPSITSFASGFNDIRSEAFDATGNLYVADAGNNMVWKVTPIGVVSSVLNVGRPTGVAFDAAGNLYVSSEVLQRVLQITPGGQTNVYAEFVDNSGLLPINFSPFGPAVVDAAGYLYVAVVGNGAGAVYKVQPGGGASTRFAEPFFGATGLCSDAAGNLYVANSFDSFRGRVNKVTPGGVVSVFAEGFKYPGSLAFDAAGNLYVGATSAGTVSKVTPAGVISTFASGFNLPGALAVDAAGNIYVGDTISVGGKVGNQGTVRKVSISHVTVPFTLTGTAVSGTDYRGVTAGSLVFAPGQTTAYITGTLVSDPGFSKTITFTLGSPSGDTTLGSPAANTLTIIEPAKKAATSTTAVLKADGSLWQYTGGTGLQLLSPAGTILSTSAVTDAAGFTDVYAITADHHLWEHTVAGWAYLSAGSFLQLSAATNAVGNAVIFAVLTDNSLWENSSLFAGDHWRLLSPGGTILSISAVTDAAGNDDVYAVTADQNLWQHGPAGWALLSRGSFQQVSAGLNGAGQALVFAVLTDHSLWENNPAFASDHWRPLSPAGTILSVSAGGSDDVFAITSDHHLWEHTAAGWAFLSVGSFASLSGATNTAGQGDVFAVLTDTSFWEYDPAFPALWQDLVPSGVAAGSAARTR
jgi:hypothetical protein